MNKTNIDYKTLGISFETPLAMIDGIKSARLRLRRETNVEEGKEIDLRLIKASNHLTKAIDLLAQYYKDNPLSFKIYHKLQGSFQPVEYWAVDDPGISCTRHVLLKLDENHYCHCETTGGWINKDWTPEIVKAEKIKELDKTEI